MQLKTALDDEFVKSLNAIAPVIALYGKKEIDLKALEAQARDSLAALDELKKTYEQRQKKSSMTWKKLDRK
jgi:hypothetical protein